MSAKDPFIIANAGRVIPVGAITEIDISTLENGRYITIEHGSGQREKLDGVQAIEALLLIKPSALEGRKLRWARNAWLLHNTVGHGYLAVLSLAALCVRPLWPSGAKRMIRHGLYIHDVTVPKPIG